MAGLLRGCMVLLLHLKGGPSRRTIPDSPTCKTLPATQCQRTRQRDQLGACAQTLNLSIIPLPYL